MAGGGIDKAVFFKGGVVEMDLCARMGFNAINLESFGVRKAPSPLEEVIFYKKEYERLTKL